MFVPHARAVVAVEILGLEFSSILDYNSCAGNPHDDAGARPAREKTMSEQPGQVVKGQVYLSQSDARRTRTVTVERTVMAKRVGATKRQLYAVGVSRVESSSTRHDSVGKKRRVFIKVKDLLSARYALRHTDAYGIELSIPASTPPIDLAAAGLPTAAAPPVAA